MVLILIHSIKMGYGVIGKMAGVGGSFHHTTHYGASIGEFLRRRTQPALIERATSVEHRSEGKKPKSSVIGTNARGNPPTDKK